MFSQVSVILSTGGMGGYRGGSFILPLPLTVVLTFSGGPKRALLECILVNITDILRRIFLNQYCITILLYCRATLYCQATLCWASSLNY